MGPKKKFPHLSMGGTGGSRADIQNGPFNRTPVKKATHSSRGQPVNRMSWTPAQWRIIEYIRQNLNLSRPQVVRGLIDPICEAVNEARIEKRDEVTVALRVRFRKWDYDKKESLNEAASNRKYVAFVSDVSEKVLSKPDSGPVLEKKIYRADVRNAGSPRIGRTSKKRD